MGESNHAVPRSFSMNLTDYDRENPKHIQELQDLSSKDQNAHARMYKQAIREKAAEVEIPNDVLQLMVELEGQLNRRGHQGGNEFSYARQTRLSFIEAYLTARFGEDTRVWPDPI